MAERIERTFVDDLSGVSSGEDPTVATRFFAWAGKDYEVDLGDANFKLMEDAIQPLIAVARPRGSAVTGRGQGKPRTGESRVRSRQIRKWAEGQGIQMSDRGRIPASVVEQYDAVH